MPSRIIDDRLLEILEDHAHKAQKCFPTLANGVTVTGHATAWTLGAIVEIIPASEVSDEFDIHHISVEGLSAAGTYEVVLYKGASGSEEEIGRTRIPRLSVPSGAATAPFQGEIMPAGTRVSAAVASNSGGGDTIDIALLYHEY